MIAEPDDRRVRLVVAARPARGRGAGLRRGPRRRGFPRGARLGGTGRGRMRFARGLLRRRGRVGNSSPTVGGRFGLAAAFASSAASPPAADMGGFGFLVEGGRIAGLPIDLAVDQLLDVVDGASVGAGDDRQGDAELARAPGAADAVDIVL